MHYHGICSIWPPQFLEAPTAFQTKSNVIPTWNLRCPKPIVLSDVQKVIYRTKIAFVCSGLHICFTHLSMQTLANQFFVDFDVFWASAFYIYSNIFSLVLERKYKLLFISIFTMNIHFSYCYVLMPRIGSFWFLQPEKPLCGSWKSATYRKNTSCTNSSWKTSTSCSDTSCLKDTRRLLPRSVLYMLFWQLLAWICFHSKCVSA